MALSTYEAPTILRRAQSIPEAIRNWTPKSILGLTVLKAKPYIPEDLWAEIVDRLKSSVVMESRLELTVFRGLRLAQLGLLPMRAVVREDYGLVGYKEVTDTGVGYIVDAFANSVELENMKYHSLGTGTTAEDQTQTALVTELTTEYTGNVRATGTTEEGATANIYKTIATNTLDGTPGAALREHGIHSASSAGVMLDRTLYSAITLASGDGVQSTYSLTFTAGS